MARAGEKAGEEGGARRGTTTLRRELHYVAVEKMHIVGAKTSVLSSSTILMRIDVFDMSFEMRSRKQLSGERWRGG